MFLNIPNHPWCFDRDGMLALTLAGVVSASLGTNFAWGGYAGSRKNLKIFTTNTACLTTPRIVIPARAGGQHLALSCLVRMATKVGISFPCVILDRQGGDPYIYKNNP